MIAFTPADLSKPLPAVGDIVFIVVEREGWSCVAELRVEKVDRGVMTWPGHHGEPVDLVHGPAATGSYFTLHRHQWHATREAAHVEREGRTGRKPRSW